MSVSNVTSFPPQPPQTQTQQQVSNQQSPLQGGKVQGGHHHHGGGHKESGVAGTSQGTTPASQTSNTDASSLSVDTTA